MLVTRKKPAVSVTAFCTAAVPMLVILISAPGTTLPAGSTTIPRIELETDCANPVIVPTASKAHTCANLSIRGESPLTGSELYQRRIPNASAFTEVTNGSNVGGN